MAGDVSETLELHVIDGNLPDGTVATLLGADNTPMASAPVLADKASFTAAVESGAQVKIQLTSPEGKNVVRTMTVGLDGKLATAIWPFDPADTSEMEPSGPGLFQILLGLGIIGLIYYSHRK
jgi:hypothetical protein